MAFRRQNTRCRAALTLMELLVVIAVLTILLAVALPLMKTGNEERKVREASRMMNGFIASVKAKAAASGRSAGFVIRRNPAALNGSYQLLYAETPRLFGGAWDESRVAIVDRGTADQPEYWMLFTLPPYDLSPQQQPTLDRDSIGMLMRMLVDEYDSPLFAVKFNYQGVFHEAAIDPSSVNLTAGTADFRLLVGPGVPLALDAPLKYQVRLRPRPAVGEPMELPDGVTIDLGYSGFDVEGTEFNVDAGQICVGGNIAVSGDPAKPPPSLTIMFQPGGALDRVYGTINQEGFSLQPLRFIHLLIGKTDNLILDDPNDLKQTNLADASNLWVTVVAATGNVVTSENAGIVVDGSVDFNHVQNRIKAREIARSATAMGGR